MTRSSLSNPYDDQSSSFDVFRGYVLASKKKRITWLKLSAEVSAGARARSFHISILLRHFEFMFSSKLEYHTAVKLWNLRSDTTQSLLQVWLEYLWSKYLRVQTVRAETSERIHRDKNSDEISGVKTESFLGKTLHDTRQIFALI